MQTGPNNSRIFSGGTNIRTFWTVFIAAVICTIIGILLGNSFEDYQTSSTL